MGMRTTTPRTPPGLAALMPRGDGAMRRFGGFALLGTSLWLVAVLAFFRAVIGVFS